jgi:hypothetical protein
VFTNTTTSISQLSGSLCTCVTSCATVGRTKHFLDSTSNNRYCINDCGINIKSQNGADYYIFTDGNECKTNCGTNFYDGGNCQDTLAKKTAGTYNLITGLPCQCLSTCSNVSRPKHFVDSGNTNKYCVAACSSSLTANGQTFRFTNGN